jgi:hypothetical protein
MHDPLLMPRPVWSVASGGAGEGGRHGVAG